MQRGYVDYTGQLKPTTCKIKCIGSAFCSVELVLMHINAIDDHGVNTNVAS